MSPAGRLGVLLAAGVLACTGAAASVRADRITIPPSPRLPWTYPGHSSPLELLAGRIASHIAGRKVTVRCEGPTTWDALATKAGLNPVWELGWVPTVYGSKTGLVPLTYTELAGERVCLPLDAFALAPTKQTKCPTSSCYLGGRRRLHTMTAAYWHAYRTYAEAIFALAHESIHLGGIVGRTLPNGRRVGDRLAEAKATCYGMQSMAYVAEQLGDTPSDAQAVARYFWDVVYPARKASVGGDWSGDCRPGGPMDRRSVGLQIWP